MHSLRFRQIHLDFHTSEAIAEIGRDFDKKHWQETLKGAHVDSITCFAVCHHGWSYYDTRVGCRHPHLDFDLTRAMYDACREINVNVPLYVTAGFNNYIARIHPQWRCINHEGHYIGSSQKPIDPGYYLLCFNTPYLDYLCQQIREVATLFPQASGMFLDIIHKSQCCCPWCLESMEQRGLKAEDPVDRAKNAEIVLDNYYRRTLEALRSVSPAMPLFQNSGHVQRGERRFLDYVTHLELESLPTGGWGYDHFAMAAKYAKLTGLDFLGMTGKFHTTWGEFGGFKHPNALRYECAAMLAYGAKCSVGDQLDPRGRLDESTYGIIAGAYAEVEAKEPWCRDATNVADVALLSSVAVAPDHPRQDDADTGASRLLLEGHVLFDILDGQMDFSPYKALVLPDDLVVSESLKAKLDAYLSAGGKLLMTGNSALAADGKTPLFDIGAEIAGPGEFKLNFILPIPSLRPDFVNSPFVVYARYPRLKVTTGESLGAVYEPYFDRQWRHFCSHQHAPARPTPSPYHCGVHKGNIMYLPMPIFTLYRAMGTVVYKQFALSCIRRLLGDGQTFLGNLPSTARVSLMEQKAHRRYILHLLHADLVNRGGKLAKINENIATSGTAIEVIEDLLPLHDVDVSLKLPQPVRRVTLEPGGRELPHRTAAGRTVIHLDQFTCHQMVVLHT